MHLKQLVHGKNLKFTPAREAILKIFSNASQPLASTHSNTHKELKYLLK
ncbi:MAG: hypothetical protein IE880_08990 [Epsilonproteobacteria bacterium]|nr:hypothetical protein [Campylobacterota bacterium]